MRGSSLISKLSTWGLLLTALVVMKPADLDAQSTSGLSRFSISDLADPKDWKPGQVTVGEAMDGVTITALDETGNKVIDFNGTVYLTQETINERGRIEPDSVALVDGEWTGTLRVFRRGTRRSRAGVVGDVWVELSDRAPDPHVGVSNLFTVIPLDFSQLLVVLPGEQHVQGSLTGKIGQPTAPQRGSEFVIEIVSTDQYWNKIHNVTDAIRITSSDPTANLPQDSRIDSGGATLTVSLDTAGPQNLTVFDVDSPNRISSYTQIVEVRPGEPVDLILSIQGQELKAMETTEIAVTLRDDAGNLAEGNAVEFTVLSGTGSVEPSTVVSDSVGVAKTLFRSGQITESNVIRATHRDLSAEVEVHVTVTPELPDNSIVNYPNPFGIGAEVTRFDYYLSQDADVTLKIYDLFGNLVWSREFSAGSPGALGRDSSVQPNSVEWPGVNDNGQLVGSGGYILMARAVVNREVIMETKRKIAVIR